MLIPYNPSPPPGSFEAAYNAAMIPTRTMIERTFGIYKGRWQCLKTGLRYNDEKSCKIIMACAVLHNLIYKFGDGSHESDALDIERYQNDDDESQSVDEDEAWEPKRSRNNEYEEGKLYRERLAKTYFSRK